MAEDRRENTLVSEALAADPIPHLTHIILHWLHNVQRVNPYMRHAAAQNDRAKDEQCNPMGEPRVSCRVAGGSVFVLHLAGG